MLDVTCAHRSYIAGYHLLIHVYRMPPKRKGKKGSKKGQEKQYSVSSN